MKRVFKIGWITLVCLFSAHVHAELTIDDPATIVARLNEKAQNNTLTRVDILDEVFAIQENIFYMSARELTEPYIYLIDEFIKILQENNLDMGALGTRAIQQLGRDLSRHIMQWIRLDQDTVDTVLAIHKWADLASAYELVNYYRSESRVYPDRLRDTATRGATLIAMAHAANTLTALMNWAETSPLLQGSPRYLIRTYENMKSELADLVFRYIEELSDERIQQWVAHISQSEGFSKVLGHMQETILGLSPENMSRIHQLIELQNAIATKMEAEALSIDFFVFDILQNISKNIIVKMLLTKEPFYENEFESLVNMLSLDQLAYLAYKWRRIHTIRDPEYSAYLLPKAKYFLSALMDNNMMSEAQDFSSFYRTVGAVHAARQHHIEGSYNITVETASENLPETVRAYRLTLVFATDDMLVAALHHKDVISGSSYAYYHVQYNLENNTYTASERPRDLYSDRNPTLEFQINGDSITGDLINQLSNRKPFEGTKDTAQVFDDYFVGASPHDTLIVGTYEGRINGMPVALYVSEVHGSMMGRLNFDNRSFFIELSVGLSGIDRGFLYLTEGINRTKPGANWVQVRARLSEDGNELIGQYISGMHGVIDSAVRLRRVN